MTAVSQDFQIVNMSQVYDACERVVGRKPVAITPDAISDVAKATVWSRLPDWDTKSDIEIAEETGLYRSGFTGWMLVVTDASFTSAGGVFRVKAENLQALVAQHRSRYGEPFFATDVIVVGLEDRRIWIFHHEGVYAMICDGPSETKS